MGRPRNQVQEHKIGLDKLVWGNIRKYMYYRDISEEKLSIALGLKQIQSIKNREKNPGIINLAELEHICIILNVEPIQLLEK